MAKIPKPKYRKDQFVLEKDDVYEYGIISHMDEPHWIAWGPGDDVGSLGIIIKKRATVFEAYRNGKYLGSFITRMKASEALTKEAKGLLGVIKGKV